MKDARTSRVKAATGVALVVGSALLAGCYVVPVAPAHGYRDYPRQRYYPKPSPRPHYHYRYRGDYGPYGLDVRPGDAAVAGVASDRGTPQDRQVASASTGAAAR